MPLTFRATVHKSGRRFVVPKHIRLALNLTGEDYLHLKIKSENGQMLFSGRKLMKSGSEIYGDDIPATLNPGQKIVVRVSVSETKQGSNRAQPHTRFWVVSPNVMDDSGTVGEWRNASIKFKAAFMGWGPHEEEHKAIGLKFARKISPGDVILIARRFKKKAEIIGFGRVHGLFRTRLPGFVAPTKRHWRGSLRVLRPFKHRTELPKHLNALAILGHTTALRELVPSRSQSERQVCKWLERELRQSDKGFQANESALKQRPKTDLTGLPNDEGLDYKITTHAQAKRAEKKEAELVQHYDKWLRDQKRTLHVAKYGHLRCDAFEAGRCNLIEAKCSTRREYIRMAVGQLLDYSHLISKDVGAPGLAILLPSRPSREIEDWLKTKLEIYVIWKDGSVFLDNANGRFI